MKKIIIYLSALLIAYTFVSCCSCEDSTGEDDYSDSQNDTDCWATAADSYDEDDEDEDECFLGYAPDDCESNVPAYGTVYIDITINSKNPAVPLIIYRGDFELGHIVLKDTLDGDRSYTLTNGYYSVKAEYQHELKQGLVTVFSVDGWDIDYDTEEYCDATCYEEGNIYLDARLDLSLFNNP